MRDHSQRGSLVPLHLEGFETYFLELAEIFRTGAFEQVEPLGARYGLKRLMDWVPELTSRYQLKLLGQWARAILTFGAQSRPGAKYVS